MKYLEDYIAATEVAYKNKLTEHEINQLADAVREFVRNNEESVEGLFDPEEDYGETVVLTKLF